MIWNIRLNYKWNGSDPTRFAPKIGAYFCIMGFLAV